MQIFVNGFFFFFLITFYITRNLCEYFSFKLLFYLKKKKQENKNRINTNSGN